MPATYRLSFLAASFLAGTGLTSAAEPWQSLSSPDGNFQVSFSLGESGEPLYGVKHGGADVITPSGLGFELEGDLDWTQGFLAPQISEPADHDSKWKPVWGETAEVRDHYRSATVWFGRHASLDGLKFEVRAYNEGVAFRYVIDTLPGQEGIRINRERTKFGFTKDHQLWAVYSAQGKYSKLKISEIQHSVERPCVLETDTGLHIAIAEAACVDFARMRLARVEDKPRTLVSNLHGPVVSTLPLTTPWRVVMAANKPGQLLENNHLLLNLNEPNKIADTSWIKPGKVIREVTLSTDGGISCVDFAVKNGLQFIEFDAGWYGPQDDEKPDAARTVSRRGLDLPRVVNYAKERGIGVILYVNRRHLERDLDELLPLYREWGIAGLKFGFVQHGDQKWTAWLHESIAKCARYKMMVDVHDEYRMTGWQRTYPNFMTAEGIGGDETRPPNEQALANLFTRMIAAPADHTFCYINGYVDSTTSHSAQLAKSICFFSPWQFLFWYNRPADLPDLPEMDFFKHLPTTWDETRVLHGAIGQYAAIARRKGDEWYIGCVSAGSERTLDLALDFLPAGKNFEAIIYRDDKSVSTPTKVRIERRDVDEFSVLKAKMNHRNGVAYRIVPKR